MTKNIHGPIKNALTELRAKKITLDRQIDALERALDALTEDGPRRRGRIAEAGPSGITRQTRKGRKPFTTAQRKAVSVRMKAAWARRRRVAAKRAG